MAAVSPKSAANSTGTAPAATSSPKRARLEQPPPNTFSSGASTSPCFPLAPTPSITWKISSAPPASSRATRVSSATTRIFIRTAASALTPTLALRTITSLKGRNATPKLATTTSAPATTPTASARWLSADWSGVPVAVPYANLTNPQTLNLYAMVSDDPESFADLDGHCCDWGDLWARTKASVSFAGQ